jgi:hypothetical protein
MRGPLWRFATAIALLAQCWIAVAAFGDARGLGASAHVEASGTNLHYAHDEADCAACRTLALNALPLSPVTASTATAVVPTAIVALRPLAPRAERVSHTRTRAPPSVA